MCRRQGYRVVHGRRQSAPREDHIHVYKIRHTKATCSLIRSLAERQICVKTACFVTDGIAWYTSASLAPILLPLSTNLRAAASSKALLPILKPDLRQSSKASANANNCRVKAKLAFSDCSSHCQSSLVLAHFRLGYRAGLVTALFAALVEAPRHLGVKLPVTSQQAIVDAVALAPQGSAAALAGSSSCIAVLTV